MKKYVKCVLLEIAKRLGLFALARRVTARGTRILCYHGVWLGEDGFAGDSMFIGRRTFEQRLATIQQLGYSVVPLETAIRAFEGKAVVPMSPIVITIDDGWYSVYAAMLPALQRLGMPATLYCDTEHLLSGTPVVHLMAAYLFKLAGQQIKAGELEADFATALDRKAAFESRLAAARKVAAKLGIGLEPYLESKAFNYMSPAQLAEAAANGLDVQLHTHRHTLHDHSPVSVQREIEDNVTALVQLLGTPGRAFDHFCYPNGVTSNGAATTLHALGLRSSTTTQQGLTWSNSPRHLLPRILDGENTAPIEFEAELSGFAEILRHPFRILSRSMQSQEGTALTR